MLVRSAPDFARRAICRSMRKLPVVLICRRRSRLCRRANQIYDSTPSRPLERGVSRSSRNVGRNAVDAEVPLTSGAEADGKIVRSWRPDAGVKLAEVILLLCTRGCGCIEHPAFPAPSVFKGQGFCNGSGAIRVAGLRSCALTSLRAQATQSIIRRAMDCFACARNDGQAI